MPTVRRRAASLPEYLPAPHVAVSEPPSDGALGYCDFNWGRQRLGDEEVRVGGFVEPGDEGRIALSLLLEDGAFGRCEHFDRVEAATPDGSEAEPGDGFERGGVRRKERK